MKKIYLLLTFLVISVLTFGQVRKPVYIVPDSTTLFGVTLPATTIIYDYGANRLWELTTKQDAADSLGNSSKELIAQLGSDLQELSEVLTLGDSTEGANIKLNPTADATDGAANGSPLLNVAGNYDADPTAGVNSTDLLTTFKTNVSLPFGNLQSDFTLTHATEDAYTIAKTASTFDHSFFSNSGSNSLTAALKSDGAIEIDYTDGVLNNGFNFDLTTANPTLAFKANSGFNTTLQAATPSALRTITFPDTSGTVALTLDITNTIYNGNGTLGANRTITSGGFDLYFTGTGRIGVGTATPDTDALLDMVSTTRGFLPPRMTNTQRDAITTPPAGLFLYDNTNNDLDYYNGTVWRRLVNAGAATLNEGGISFADATGSSLTNDSANLFWDNSTKILGIGTSSPSASAALDITSTTKGLLFPRMTAAQGSAITKVDGLMIYVTSTDATFTAVGFWGVVANVWTQL